MKILIKDAKQFIGKKVTIRGWVYNLRSSGSIAFLQIRDGSGFIQAVVVKNDLSEEKWEEIKSITIETSIILEGEISAHPKKDDIFELQLSDFDIVQISEEYPIGKKEHGPAFLLDHRHLWLRSQKQWAIQSVRDCLIRATYDFFNKEGFKKTDTPILTPNACEGTTTLFAVDYFDLGQAYLSQSGQLYLEALIFSAGRCYDFGPVFRAEKSKTRRHLTEFWMMDAEAAFVEHDENMEIQENMIEFMIQKVLKECKKELAILERDISKLEKIKAPFGRITHHDAVEKLQKMGSKITHKDDLGAEDETMLTQDSDVPIFVEKWPKEIKAFYMKRDSENKDLVLGSDLIATEGHGELIGGAQREDDYDILKSRIEEEGLSMEDFQWYLDLRKYGSVPHSGFGYGLERIVGWVCGVHHVRETIPFPRMMTRIRP